MKKRRASRDTSALNSRLIRRPIQRWFPLFLLPTFAAFCIGFLYPFCKGLFLSFCKFKLTSRWTWVGFDNYLRIFKDGGFVHAFWYTALFALVSLVIINVFAFMVAYALTQGIKGSNIFWGLIILLSWQQIGYMMIIYIAGLQAVPEDMLEAARIDGATRWQTLWKITIPNVMPSFTICTFLSLTNGFKLYDQNLALTNGLPLIQNPDGSVIKTTEMLALNIVNSYTSNATNRGPGQAKAVVFFILVAAISIIQLRATRKREVQQ